ncbi:hypothetical protein VPHK348_0039 [Vibrio phage K348]
MKSNAGFYYNKYTLYIYRISQGYTKNIKQIQGEYT